jgi:hypothetical protein
VNVKVTGVAVLPSTRGQPSQRVVVLILELMYAVFIVEEGIVDVENIAFPVALTMYE